MSKILNIVGARPNFMKVAPIHRRMQQSGGFYPILIHTGQHYDERMSKAFFGDLNMPEPDVYLGVGSGTHAEQTAAILTAMEKIILQKKPDWVLVVGDVNSTLAAALAAVKMHVPVAHVEAGLRSNDRTMPEEINRILTDAMSDLLFVSEQSGMDNLAKEGVSAKKAHFVGNVMIDSLIEHLEKAQHEPILERFNLRPRQYALMTLHRPSNVDHPESLQDILSALQIVQNDMPLIFPIHPRTQKMLEHWDLEQQIRKMPHLFLTEPLGYLAFLRLMSQARIVLTDSGGIQEETTYLGIPCVTLRENTERPVTTRLGTNLLVGIGREAILQGYRKGLDKSLPKQHRIPPLWDGKTSERIVAILSANS